MKNENQNYKLYFDEITMLFPGVVALDDVSFGILPGTIHVVMGENGAGKSTLMKIIDGIYQPSAGNVLIDGEQKKISSTRDAQRYGIAMIHQELQFIPDLTLERYLMLGQEERKAGFINWRAVSEDAKRVLAENNLDFDLKQQMREFSVSEIQLLEITRAIKDKNIDILIMDEPTSALSSDEVERLFAKIKELKSRGITIIYISHKFDEIFRIADYITVMRDGKHIHTAPAAEYTRDSLIQMMVGRELSNIYPKVEVPIGDIRLEVRNLTCAHNGIRDISFTVRAGEIVGLGGLMGAGRTEVVRAIFGLDPVTSGKIFVDGAEVKIKSSQDAVRNGVALATEDRRINGLVLCRPLHENAILANLRRLQRFGFVRRGESVNQTQALFDRLRVKAPSIHVDAGTLSGGNQQKVVLAKWLMTSPKVLILDEPTRGIDVGAKHEIYKIMVDLARTGMAIVMISSELPEFIGMCDRAYVMSSGRIQGELNRAQMTQESIMEIAVGGTRV